MEENEKIGERGRRGERERVTRALFHVFGCLVKGHIILSWPLLKVISIRGGILDLCYCESKVGMKMSSLLCIGIEKENNC